MRPQPWRHRLRARRTWGSQRPSTRYLDGQIAPSSTFGSTNVYGLNAQPHDLVELVREFASPHAHLVHFSTVHCCCFCRDVLLCR
jgi:hypothetical protein